MKIVSQTNEKIILLDTSILEIFVGSVFVALGVYAGYMALYTLSAKDIILPILFIISGCFVLLFATQRKTIGDKNNNTITIEKKTILKTMFHSYSFVDIAQIELRELIGRPTQYQIVLLLKNGTSVALDTPIGGKSGILWMKKDRYQGKKMRIASLFASFVGVDFKSTGPHMFTPLAK